MIKEFKNFTIEYSEDDLTYIDDLLKHFLFSQNKIMSFFNLEKLDKNVQIKIWNDVIEYEKYIKNEMKRIFNVDITMKDWEVGRAITTKTESQIHILSYKERIKRKGHKYDKIDDLIKVVPHEFAHTCHAQFKNYQPTLTWINEALATILSNQYDDEEPVLDCTLDELLNGKVNYLRYNTLGKYLFKNYDKKYILELAKNNELLKQKTPIIFEEAKEWIKQNETNIAFKKQ